MTTPVVFEFGDISDHLLQEILRYLSFRYSCKTRRISHRFNHICRSSLDHVAFDLKSINKPRCGLVSPDELHKAPEACKQYVSCLERPGSKPIKSILVYGSGRKDFYRHREHLRLLSENLGAYFPKLILWANFRIDAVIISCELLNLRPYTQLLLYDIEVAGIDWSSDSLVFPSHRRETLYDIFITGLEMFQFPTDLVYTERKISEGAHISALSTELLRLGHKYARPMNDAELYYLSSAMSFHFIDVKPDLEWPVLSVGVKNLISLYYG
ncbi:hypothetical protein RvY_02617-2 [Ramazzottius varieornatus]|uniref:F-box domain-containing protein n=2 Tax=Ramazzottius varieornatus TaxID=947166 RepID=A0A1D1USD2_RAMVA|nr:hypothetical protein RvY_02617-2 [Ramazzottius varieornatus]